MLPRLARRTTKVAPRRPFTALRLPIQTPILFTRNAPSTLSIRSIASTSYFTTTRIATTSTATTTSSTLAKMTVNGNRAFSTVLNQAPTVPEGSPLSALPLYTSLPASVLPSGFAKVPATATCPSYTLFTNNIEKSPNDTRDYRVIRLENGLEALLVHDAKADKAAASMTVQVGHLSDPVGLQGLAHFCEHLLFMGTEKYPKENEYSEYLSKNSGGSNAFTGMDDTNYFFDVHPSALSGALDRFAQFFIAPLFDPSCTEREIRAVDSEHKKNLQSDMWRSYQLDKETSSRDHAFWRFGTGNLETLWDAPRREGKDVRDELLDFHGKYYSANVMKLAVLGKESLDDLAELVVKQFSAVKNKDLQPHVFSGSPYGPQELATSIYLKTVKDSRSLDLTYPFPDQGPYFESKPGSFLSHYLGHEGKGSLLSFLKKKGWANALSAGVGGGTTGFDFFRINVDLTQEGLANHKSVVLSCFSYLDLLRSTPPQEWAFREVAQLQNLNFQFQEEVSPMGYVMSLSGQMQKPYPREYILSGSLLMRKWEGDLIGEMLKGLIPEHCRIMVGSQIPLDGIEYNEKERWYGTEFARVPVDSSLRPESTAPGALPFLQHGDLELPGPNSFLPEDLAVERREVKEISKRPKFIRETPTGSVWHKKDDRWWLPRAAVFMHMRNPLVDETPEAAVSARLFVELVKDALNEYSYDAAIAGLSYRLDSTSSGIQLTVEGYNDKLSVLAQKIMERMKSLEVDPQRFELIKDMLERAYKNFKLDAPYGHAGFWMTVLTQERYWTHEQKEAALAKLTPADITAFAPKLFERLHIETLVHGNMYKADAIRIADMAENIFKPSALTAEELLSRRARTVPTPFNATFRKPVPNPSNVNSGLEYFCYVGDDADRALRIRLSLYAQIAHEPCFNTLRTQEQLGYIVASSSRKTIGACGFRVVVQSERDAAYVETRIEAFLEKTLTELLEKISEEDFEREKMSLINKKLEDHKNGWEESSHYWINMQAGYYDFLRKYEDAEALKALTKKDIVDFHHRYFHPASPTRSKVSAHLQSQHVPVPLEALETLSKALADRGIAADPEGFEKFMEDKPDLPALRKFSEEYLVKQGASAKDKADLLDMIDALQVKTPLVGVTMYDDVDTLRSLLPVGPHATPVADYKAL